VRKVVVAVTGVDTNVSMEIMEIMENAVKEGRLQRETNQHASTPCK
jgi:enterochelin esterase-like enzyme